MKDGGELDWFGGDGEPDLNAVGRYIGSSIRDGNNTAVALSIKRLKQALEADKAARIEVGCWCTSMISGDLSCCLSGSFPPPLRLDLELFLFWLLFSMQALQRCDSAGIMCLIAAAHPELYLEESNTRYTIPPEVLELDMRGRVDLPATGEYLYVDIGEVKRSLDYRKAIEQLGLRLGALGWFAAACVPSGAHERPPDVRLVGRLFVREAGLPNGDDGTDQFQRNVARERWGFSLYRHIF